MRYLYLSVVFLSAALIATSAMADDKENKKGDGDRRAEMREKMLKEFDKDGDGKLSDEEREKARNKMRELHGGKKGEKGEKGEGHRRKEGRGREAHRGPEGRHDGPPKLPRPEEMFAKFDKDKDEKLSKDEFMALAEFVHDHMPPPPGAGRQGPPGGRFEGRGPDGPRFRGGEGPEGRFRGPEGGPRGDGPRGDRRPPKHDKDKDDDKGEKGDKDKAEAAI